MNDPIKSDSPDGAVVLPRFVRRELVWHPGPANGGGGTAQDESPDSETPWWSDGDMLIVIVDCINGPETSCIHVRADEDGLEFVNAATGDFDFGWTDREISWWAKLDDSLPNAESIHPESKPQNHE